jgi:hypothetical protein
MWKAMAEQASDPKVITLEVKRLGHFAVREIGTFSLKAKGSAPKEITAEVRKHLQLYQAGKPWREP